MQYATKNLQMRKQDNQKQRPEENHGTLGSYNGTETCGFVGSYQLHQLHETTKNQDGLYVDYDLEAFKNSPQCLEEIKKHICKVFQDNGLKISMDANKKIANYLDLTLNLNKGTH